MPDDEDELQEILSRAPEKASDRTCLVCSDEAESWVPKVAIDLMLEVIEQYQGDPVPLCRDCEDLCTSDDCEPFPFVEEDSWPCLQCVLGNFCLEHDLDWLAEMIEDEFDEGEEE